jgi:hypothetical protein
MTLAKLGNLAIAAALIAKNRLPRLTPGCPSRAPKLNDEERKKSEAMESDLGRSSGTPAGRCFLAWRPAKACRIKSCARGLNASPAELA